MRNTKIIFWITTTFIFLFQGLMPALTGHTELAKEGIRHLGYPAYFGTLLNIFKVVGAIILMIPAIHPRVKEWAYAGFAFDFIFAGLSLWIVDGPHSLVLLPVVAMLILAVSYVTYHQIRLKGSRASGLHVANKKFAGSSIG